MSYTGSTPALGAGRLGSIPSTPRKSRSKNFMNQNQKQKSRSNGWYYLLLTFGILGLIDAGYLTYKSFAGGLAPCSLTGGCEDVLHSQFSSFLDVPLAVFGVIFYLAVLVLTYAGISRGRARAFTALFWISISAVAISLFLSFVQIFVIKAICAYCMLSTILSIFILANITILKFGEDSPLRKNREDALDFSSSVSGSSKQN